MEPIAGNTLATNYVLKDGDSFIVADAAGDIEGGSDGFFHNDTRLLSRFLLRLGDSQPALLSAAVSRDNVMFVAHLTNRPLPPLGGSPAAQGVIHLQRERFLRNDRLYERIACMNYGRDVVQLPLRLSFAADFRDMFEVRGSVRAARGELLAAESTRTTVVYRYRGLDEAVRTSVLAFSREPARLEPDIAEFMLELHPGVREELYLECGTIAVDAPSAQRFRDGAVHARATMRSRQRRAGQIHSGGPLFDAWMDKSRADLALLTSELDTGPYPYAGIPWFSTPFGRDAVITALQTLWLDPGIARGVLAFLAHHQAQEESAFLDAAPGKIMHETRKGEMAAMRELPFGRYYGGVDTTPLFVTLAGAYAERTGDLMFIERLWPALRAATQWIERVCDGNRDGFLDYARGSSTGLANQGWKDSEDSVFHADGRFPRGPIALVEVQGYAFAALRAMALLAKRRNDVDAAMRWQERSERLRAAVEERFWMSDAGYYGIAVDGDGALCRVRASNPGHLLFAGLPDAGRAASVAANLLTPAFHTGWGLRTLASDEVRYNPMSYHNGSVWPHDTALCAAGLARYGDRAAAVRLLRGMFEAAVHFDLRLPELFCGFPRAQGPTPVAYPVACLPQAWAAGSAFMLLQSCLGLEIDGWRGEVRVERPMLPPGIDRIAVRHVAVDARRVDVVFQRQGDRIGTHLEGRDAAAVPLRFVG
ncbi:amylo-alpha-1,6-glucosidase [Lysobacter solisilvae (ex Woo and Kim 2020)]|uniref:Amylo-alpha-1,6-glucosidase n=1 Tax=Agrilutibacter terrestris TaxID=2865112 RepID=A0A7H0FXQ6_9GAMM|nr:amylo-alpha-1,6-glucosidase [Lysobacter terrestris]QNP40822.1 amylo-alpha-1,6-glucosidase [Lysobacter terrestris]